MHSAIAIAAFAAGALAVPYKRDVVTNYNVVYVTDVVTVTGYGSQEAPAATSKSEAPKAEHYGHHVHSSWSYSYSAVEATTPVEETSAAAAPTSYAQTSTYVAPISTYVAPSSTYVAPTSIYVAPTSTYVAPTTTSAPESTSQAPSSTVAASSAAAPSGYNEIVVYHHNLHRANHSAPDLEWSDDLASSAATIAASCVYAHNVDVAGGGYGQNIAAGVEADNVSAIITDLFYNGEEPFYAANYGLDDPDMSLFEKWGHFSQIVWKDTTHVGCATQYCPGGLANVGTGVSPYFTVCNYKNPGNYAGEYGTNVLKPVGDATAEWSAGLSGLTNYSS